VTTRRAWAALDDKLLAAPQDEKLKKEKRILL
jgi:hypothetical protein